MNDPAAGDVSLACAGLLVDELVRRGLAGAAIAPGSRSTPIALALARHPGVNLHVHLDERSAGFFALGLAKATRRPAAVACTSGTATANLFPAVVEAAQAGVPLIVLTADRPDALRGTGANQTIDQIRLYGGYPNLFVDAPTPEAHAGAAGYWRSLGAQAARAATRPPGPVHINLPFVEPLVPTGSVVDLGDAAAEPAPANPADDLDPVVIETVAGVLSSTDRGIVIAGTLREEAPAIAEMAAAAGWPLVAEPTSGLRIPGAAFASGTWLVGDARFAAEHRPDAMLQIGAAPTSRAALAFVAAADRLVVVTEDGRPADPHRRAAPALVAAPDALARAVLGRMNRRGETEWLAAWRTAAAGATRAVNAMLDADEEPFEGRVARDLAGSVSDGSTLVAASSMPVRDLDAYMASRTGVRVLANRGASGIDGFVSTVLGVAASGAETVALAGDLSLLHDAGALLWSARRGYQAVFVVVNNDGGGIFDLLPTSALAEHDRLFVTPHGLDLGAFARASSAGYERIAKASDLVPAIRAAAGGVSIVEVPIDRGTAVRRRREIADAVAEALRHT